MWLSPSALASTFLVWVVGASCVQMKRQSSPSYYDGIEEPAAGTVINLDETFAVEFTNPGFCGLACIPLAVCLLPTPPSDETYVAGNSSCGAFSNSIYQFGEYYTTNDDPEPPCGGSLGPAVPADLVMPDLSAIGYSGDPTDPLYIAIVVTYGGCPIYHEFTATYYVASSEIIYEATEG